MNYSCVFCQDRVVIAVAYDCVEKMVYWSDITGPAISKASVGGGDIIPVITKGAADLIVCSQKVPADIYSLCVNSSKVCQRDVYCVRDLACLTPYLIPQTSVKSGYEYPVLI